MRAISEADVLNRIRTELETVLDRPIAGLEPSATFERLGIDSGSATLLVLALEDWLDIELDPEKVLQMATVGELSSHVASLATADAA